MWVKIREELDWWGRLVIFIVIALGFGAMGRAMMAGFFGS
jgi:hypothetical protein